MESISSNYYYAQIFGCWQRSFLSKWSKKLRNLIQYISLNIIHGQLLQFRSQFSMNQQPKPSGNPFAQVVQKSNDPSSSQTNKPTINAFDLSIISNHQSSNNTSAKPNQNQTLSTNAFINSSQKPAEKTSETSNTSDKTVKMTDLKKINETFFKSMNPAVSAYNASKESANALETSTSAQKRNSNMAKKSSKRPNQREEIIVIDQSQTNNGQPHPTKTTQETQKNVVPTQITQTPTTSLATGSQNPSQMTQQLNQNQSMPSNFYKNNTQSNPNDDILFKPIDDFEHIKQNVQMVINKPNPPTPQVQNNSPTITGGILGQAPSTSQTMTPGLPQNNINSTFNNKSQGQSTVPPTTTNTFPITKNQSNFPQNSSNNPNLSASRVQTTQSPNFFNNQNNQTQSNNNQSSAFNKFQGNNNLNSNQNSTTSPFANHVANQNQNANTNITQNQTPNQNQQFNNQNQNPQFGNQNQNQNGQLNQPTNNNQQPNQNHNNGINLHFIPEMTADQYHRKTKALHLPPSQHYESLVQLLQQKYQNEDIDLNVFLNECIQNLQYIYSELEELSTRPAVLIDQFEQNKILKQKCEDLYTTLALEPHNMLMKIKKIENKLVEGYLCTEKMECKIQEQFEHHLSAAIKDIEEINEQIEQQALDLPSQSQHDLIKIYNHLASIDSELSQLNQTADYYINLFQTQ